METTHAPDDLPEALSEGRLASNQPHLPSTGITLKQYAILVGVGAFVTTFAQQRVLGNYPTLFLLKNHFKLKQEDISFFFFWATFAWSIKPIAGIFTDAFPMLGTRRRHYMIFGSGIAGACWLIMSQCDQSYQALLIISVLVNIATVIASTVMGGLMVEAGQAFGAPGRIASLRQSVQSLSQIGGPLLGGWLAGEAFGWKVTTGLAAGASLSLTIVAIKVLREKSIKQRDRVVDSNLKRPSYKLAPGIWAGLIMLGSLAGYLFYLGGKMQKLGISLFAIHATFDLILGIIYLPTRNPAIIKAQNQLVEIVRSKTLWMAVAMLFLVYMVPGFNTPLTFHQSEDLKFSELYIGILDACQGFFGVCAAALYALFCRKINLRRLLIGSIWLNGAFTLLFLYYTRGSAPFVHSATGFAGILSELALMDLAVRSTPRGCEALGFALMMSIRNFGIAMSDIIGSKLINDLGVSFNKLVLVNSLTTMAVLLFVPFLPKLVMLQKEGEG